LRHKTGPIHLADQQPVGISLDEQSHVCKVKRVACHRQECHSECLFLFLYPIRGDKQDEAGMKRRTGFVASQKLAPVVCHKCPVPIDDPLHEDGITRRP
jgi:hypothetical protein